MGTNRTRPARPSAISRASGTEKRLSRFPELYSRVGFAHQYRALQDEELSFVLTRRWRQLGLGLDDADFTDAQAVAAIVRITSGNFRLLHRLFVQIERILKINGLNGSLTKWRFADARCPVAQADNRPFIFMRRLGEKACRTVLIFASVTNVSPVSLYIRPRVPRRTDATHPAMRAPRW
jgi:hypothetical protein